MLRKKRIPVEEYFKTQTRFKGLSKSQINAIQKQVDEKWEEYGGGSK